MYWMSSRLQLQRYDNAEARLDNAWDRLHNERRQTANVVYQFRQKGNHGLHKRVRTVGGRSQIERIFLGVVALILCSSY